MVVRGGVGDRRVVVIIIIISFPNQSYHFTRHPFSNTGIQRHPSVPSYTHIAKLGSGSWTPGLDKQGQGESRPTICLCIYRAENIHNNHTI